MCVDGAALYGPLPAPAQRVELVARLHTLFGSLHEDREGAARAARLLGEPARVLARDARSPRAFFGGLDRLLAEVRPAHGSGGFFVGATLPWLLQGTSVGACFGEMDRDLAGGGRGYGVFRAAEGSALRVGDVVARIDGREPAAWIAEHAPPGTPDPTAEAAAVALGLTSTLERLASTLDVSRCTAPGACTTVRVEVAGAAREVLAGRRRPSPTRSPRFREAVVVPPGRDPSGYAAAFEETGADGVVSVQTNGMPGDDAAWLATVARGFDRAAGGPLLFDARLGAGGGGAALSLVADRVRVDATFGVLFLGRWGHDLADGPSGFFERAAPCWDVTFATFGDAPPLCFALGAAYRFAPSGRATSRPRKIAWLDALTPGERHAAAFAKGARARVFASTDGGPLRWAPDVPSPGRTGAGVSLQARTNSPPFAGARRASARPRRRPDVVVVQRQSDALPAATSAGRRARGSRNHDTTCDARGPCSSARCWRALAATAETPQLCRRLLAGRRRPTRRPWPSGAAKALATERLFVTAPRTRDRSRAPRRVPGRRLFQGRPPWDRLAQPLAARPDTPSVCPRRAALGAPPPGVSSADLRSWRRFGSWRPRSAPRPSSLRRSTPKASRARHRSARRATPAPSSTASRGEGTGALAARRSAGATSCDARRRLGGHRLGRRGGGAP